MESVAVAAASSTTAVSKGGIIVKMSAPGKHTAALQKTSFEEISVMGCKARVLKLPGRGKLKAIVKINEMMMSMERAMEDVAEKAKVEWIPSEEPPAAEEKPEEPPKAEDRPKAKDILTKEKAAIMIQRAVRKNLFGQGQVSIFSIAVSTMAQRKKVCVSVFNDAAAQESMLDEERFFQALTQMFPRLNRGQCNAIFKGFTAKSKATTISITDFTKIVEVVGSGDEVIAEFSSMSVTKFKSLGVGVRGSAAGSPGAGKNL